ncbi:MAG: DNA alkylation repair protein [Candidatus Dormiibacterota bacterium]
MATEPGDPIETLVAAVRRTLAANAEPAKAGPMQAYMRSAMPYRGVPTPVLRRALGPVFAAHPLPDRSAWERAVRALFWAAEYREERYAAVDLTGHRQYRTWLDLQAVPLLEAMIAEGAWWDYVDELAIRRVGPILRANHDEMTPLLHAWARDEHLWKRRAAIICQVGSKGGTDRALLTDAIDENVADPDFFIRKGIGWALREYAKTEPDWVRTFVYERRDRLSPLSQREARKHLTDAR